MKIYLIILNFIIFDFLNCVESTKISHNEVEEIGVSEQALKKLQELKKLELDLLIDIVKKDIYNKDTYTKYHCISSDYALFNKKDEISNYNKHENNNTEQNKEDSESIHNGQNKKSTSFINKITSFLGIFHYSNKNKISPKINIQEYNIKNEENDDKYSAETSALIHEQKPNSYMQLKGFSLIKKNNLFGSKESSNENAEIGNYGSFFFIFGTSNTDYPWACVCDPHQLIEYKKKKRTYVLCHNQIDMSIQNSDLICNYENFSYNIHLCYIFIFLIILIYM
ncbi:conserved Plasmodium protein, unknown function [Plasmodium gallinaceum]|uniref:Fam-b protein n=1 Tax=Plasmodium gallinaceum TaxID=5849 RepID=A0A1J1GTR9_PLAGA|nr:conserved Plasmodium protein, unknown function [Plasmodium gallinaceum]CRG95847.1 conserved Plasmodium protein, unknown function [Plasmodium gallinaceum]